MATITDNTESTRTIRCVRTVEIDVPRLPITERVASCIDTLARTWVDDAAHHRSNQDSISSGGRLGLPGRPAWSSTGLMQYESELTIVGCVLCGLRCSDFIVQKIASDKATDLFHIPNQGPAGIPLCYVT